ncbi:MAG: aldo/keto reductase [Lachnospiraceae bacterium]|nr:aldo/keto reductase [Lachnospiraceae bacterium]MDD3616706.1 aldo/keto reductase [Lachnospiraceae bacterium]
MKKLGFGFMRLPVHDEENRATVNMELTKNMVDLFMKSGLNYFDTAHRYNDEMSEVALKQTLTDRYDRNTYILANKITMNYIKSEQDQEPFFHNQLKTCGVSYFDNYLVHNMGEAFYPLACKYHTFEFIRKMKEQGYVRHVAEFIKEVSLPATFEQMNISANTDFKAVADSTFLMGGCCKKFSSEELLEVLKECQ